MNSSPLLRAFGLAALLSSTLASAESADPQIARGSKTYAAICVACHQANGQGIPTLFPPLAKSDFLMADKERSIRIVLKGLTGPITVNGKPFNGVMPPPGLKPEQVADVLTYVRSGFGNTGDPVTVAEVEAVAKAEK